MVWRHMCSAEELPTDAATLTSKVVLSQHKTISSEKTHQKPCKEIAALMASPDDNVETAHK